MTAESERLRRLYETVLSATPDFVYVFSLDHRVLYANDSLIRMWGRGRDGAIGKTFLEIGYEPWHAEMHDREIDQVRATKQPIRGEVPFTGTNGRRIYDYIFVPVIGADGEVEAVAGTTRDVTDRKESELALAEADRKKDEFIALLAHELRNPLAPIRNGLQVMRLARDPAVRERAQEMMDRQLAHMVRLIDDLLDVSRISRNKMELRRARVPLADVVESAVETAQPAIDAAGHELTVSLPARPVHLDADLTRLAQVLSNLLTNSGKYTERGGTIWLSAERQDGRRRGRRSRTPASASRASRCRASSTCSPRWTAASSGRPAASASGWRWSRGWSRCTAARWRPRATARDRAARSPSRFRPSPDAVHVADEPSPIGAVPAAAGTPGPRGGRQPGRGREPRHDARARRARGARGPRRPRGGRAGGSSSGPR